MKLPRRKKEQAFLAVGLLIALLLPVWIGVVAPEVTKLPDNFYYGALIFSVDNLYDQARQSFGGEFFSNTHFYYQALSKEDGVLLVKNVFDVRKFSGEPIFTVERLYGIDQKTGKHVPGYGDKTREGYLFAPRGLQKGEGFTYWHINYDTPAHLQFRNEETINGLRVHHYETDYSADQTKELQPLLHFSESTGMALDVHLELWVEPVTGRMVKYEDRTTAHYFNQSTGERLRPWNMFHNQYNPLSIEKQVEIAKDEKFKATIIKKVIPTCLAVLALLFLLVAYKKPGHSLLFGSDETRTTR